jgi:hypothetical protein
VAARAAADQAGGDAVMAVRVQELQDIEPSTVRDIAGRWVEGLRAVLASAGAAGLIGAPLAAGKLSASTEIIVGGMLAGVLVIASSAMLLVMTAAYGSARRRRRPANLTQYQRYRQEMAQHSLRCLMWGRRLAVLALLLFAVTISVAWGNP